jgi:hypothetical protein
MADFRYRAFIAYSHQDEAWAKWLPKALETYRVLAQLVESGRPKNCDLTRGLSGGEGGIRTHVPELPDHPISSRRRCDRFGTSPLRA